MKYFRLSFSNSLRLIVIIISVLALSTQIVTAQRGTPDTDLASLIEAARNSKVSQELLDLAAPSTFSLSVSPSGVSARSASAGNELRPTSTRVQIIGNLVVVDAYANDPDALFADLTALGLQNGAQYRSVVSGLMPLSALQAASQLESLRFMMPSILQTNAGSVQNEAVFAQEVDEVFDLYGLDGSGIMVGVISDSFDCGQFGGLPGTPNPNRYADDIASGDLPDNVLVLQDWTCGIDEGRAMAQLVHDIAPGADLAFHTANGGLANFAQGIIDLADAGADVIVDDIIYLAEPMFADGIIAQAVDEVTSRGISYFSSAGNRATQGYQSPYVDSGQVYDLSTDLAIPPGLVFWELHDFDPGAGIDTFQNISTPVGGTFDPWLQWSDAVFDPFGDGLGTGQVNPGAQTDLDILPFVDGVFDLSLYLGLSNIGYVPLDILAADYIGTAGETFEIAIGLFDGPQPEMMRYVDFGGAGSIIEFGNNAPTLFGHNNAGGRTGNAELDPEAIGSIAVGAAFWGTTPAYGVTPPLVNAFSSYGPTPIYYDIFGNPYPAPIEVPKPQITGIDGSNTTFFFSDSVLDADTTPNFFGTSAAAPNAAAVAALMLEANPTLSSADVLERLQLSAIDIVGTNTVGGAFGYNQNIALPAGFDFASGAGLIQADIAVQLSITSPELTCNGLAATVYVQDGIIVGGPLNGQAYSGILRGETNVDDVIAGTNVDDLIRGGSGNDTICGFAGDDNIQGEDGSDTILAGTGDDTVTGANGVDTIYGEDGDDNLDGGEANDVISGGDGADTISGANGDDTLSGDAGDDSINGNSGADVISGGDDNDTLDGNNGNDTVSGDAGDDLVSGGNDDDAVYGGADNDELSGNGGDDALYGEAGDDVILGNDDDDYMNGGDDSDLCDGGIGDDFGENCEVLQNADPFGVVLPQITGLVLINADTDTVVGPISDGAVVDTDAIGTRNLNIVAETDAGVESVIFTGSFSRIENVAPYAVGGDNSGDYLPITMANGSYNLTATAYTGDNGTGNGSTPVTINFTVTGS